jgi:predicted nucleic acid-binding protein
MPRFVDASVFVHAYLRPRRELKPHERKIKAQARAIVARVNEGEAVVTSAVHFSEVANVLEDWIGLDAAQAVQRGLCVRETVEVLPVARGDLLEALSTATEVGVGMTDALAAVLMRDRGIREIYSFDRDFDRFEDIRRFTE